ncbi:hypothetical protein BDF20DRAFT_917884 [Mycotypha africana]|uniref:uncharacterized protein n=1 Tax=Mycotypha africana TaxID=64632 RepID=UPI002301CDD0|nr:uncharacterized protein BDF20DRAFT_917884 [Mycotypha africana]KAI8967080.1 hypothetical protein BDF20DRAFT_917884 [Mycotypha africana]
MSYKVSLPLCRHIVSKQAKPSIGFRRSTTAVHSPPPRAVASCSFATTAAHTRGFASRSASSASNSTRTIRIPPMVVALSSLAFICLGIGLYEHFWSDIQRFPPAVRQPLRKGLYYQHKGDLALALKYIQESLDTALQSPEALVDQLGTTAPLTGIMIQLGAVQEQMGRTVEARRTFLLALRYVVGLDDHQQKPHGGDMEVFENALFHPHPPKDVMAALSPTEQKKAIGLAQKLGDLASMMQADEEAEKWYVWSVEHLLKLSSRPVSDYGDTADVLFDKEHMPDWLTETDVGASLEALGGFYASRNKPSLAIPLYLKALNLHGVTSCHATVLMNNLAEAYSALGQYEEAKLWAQKGLDLAQNPNTRKINKDGDLCDETCGILLYNMGMLFEQSQNREKAKQFYENAQKHARQHKQIDCLKETHLALRRLELGSKKLDV